MQFLKFIPLHHSPLNQTYSPLISFFIKNMTFVHLGQHKDNALFLRKFPIVLRLTAFIVPLENVVENKSNKI